ncbi:unnamed protein product [Phaeothamnion confervicola]
MVLGVEPGAGRAAVRRAYYRLSLAWHPDRWPRHPLHAPLAQAVFEHVAAAYAELTALPPAG